MVRLTRAWRALAADQRLAGVSALALLFSMLLPWYEKDVAVGSRIVSDRLSAFGVLSWVEAAIFLLSAGVAALLFFRAERRAFHLPGGDGTVIFGAGLWSAFLLFWRVFDRPGVHGRGATVGIQWGFFIAFVAAGALSYAGWRIRAAQPAEPTARQDPTTRVEPAPPPPSRGRPPTAQEALRRRRRAAGPDAQTQIAGQLSFEEGEEPEPRP
jgi:hypothetical protein